MDTITTLDLLDTLDFLKVKKSRLSKSYKKRINPFEIYDDEVFRDHYRFTKENAWKLISLVETDLEGNNRGGRIPSHIQVLAALRCWGRNQMQTDCGVLHGCSQATMSRICQNVAKAFAKLAKHLIKIPVSEKQQLKAMQNFEKLTGLKGIIGVIDGGKQLQTQMLGGDVQIICDASLKIIDIALCWKTNNQDSRTLNENKIRDVFENDKIMGRLVGDAGCKHTDYILTPLDKPRNNKDIEYNKQHMTAMHLMDMAFEKWKRRFRILLEKIRLSQKNSETLIVALAVLHNLSLRLKERDF